MVHAATNATKQPMKLNLSLPWLTNQQVSIIHDNEARTTGLSQGAVNKKGILTIEMQPMGGAMIYTK